MVVETRIDHRLIHGQVVYAWTNYLSVNAILVANDEVADDLFRKRIMNLAKPNGVKLIFKTVDESINVINSGLTDEYRLFIIVENVLDAYRLFNGTGVIKTINLGLSTKRDETKNIAKAVYIDKNEEDMLREMSSEGVFVNVKQTPTDSDKNIIDLI